MFDRETESETPSWSNSQFGLQFQDRQDFVFLIHNKIINRIHDNKRMKKLMMLSFTNICVDVDLAWSKCM